VKYQSNPNDSHLKTVKRILRDIYNIVNYDLFYPRSSIFELMSSNDADFAGCKSDKKSTSTTCHFCRYLLISGFKKKQNSVSYRQSRQNI